MSLTLEDLTKDELILLFCKYHFRGVPQRELHRIVWERMAKESQRIMDKACNDIDTVKGKRDGESVAKWLKYSDDFNKGMKLSKKAQNYFEKNLNT